MCCLCSALDMDDINLLYLSECKVTPFHSLHFYVKHLYIMCFNFVHDMKVTPHFSGIAFFVCMTKLVRVAITNDTFALRQLCKKKGDGSRCFPSLRM